MTDAIGNNSMGLTERPFQTTAASDGYFQSAAHKAWWRHQMETFPALLAICAGNSPVTGEFPTQRPVTRSFDGFFLSAPE